METIKKRALLLLAFTCVSLFMHAQVTFAPFINYPINATADHVTAGDFNHDGKTDIAVATSISNSQVLIYYQNALTGQLDTPAAHYQYPGTYPQVSAIASGDVNNDGREDIVIAFGDSIGIYIQSTSGTMGTLACMWCSAGNIAVIKTADVDMDGFIDIIAVPHSSSPDVIVYYGSTGDGFTQVNYPTPYIGSYLDDLRIGKIGSDTLNSLVRMSGEFFDPITRLRIHTDRTLDSTIIHNIIAPFTDNKSAVEIGRFTDTTANQMAASYGGNVPSSHLAIWRHPCTEYLSDTIIDVTNIP